MLGTTKCRECSEIATHKCLCGHEFCKEHILEHIAIINHHKIEEELCSTQTKM